MPIDWFTVAAQFINFLILVVVMKRLLYRPILDAIVTREKRIADTLHHGEKMKDDAAAELSRVRQEQEQLQSQKSALLRKAAEEVDEQRKRLIATAREEVLRVEMQWRYDIAKAKDSLRQDLTGRVQAVVLEVTRQVLHDLAGAELERSIAHEFIEQLRALSGDEKEKITACLKGSDSPVVVRSVFSMPERQKREIEEAIREQLWPVREVRFETEPKFIAGIEMSTPGYRLSWSIDASLSELEKKVKGLLDTAAQDNAANGQ